jgi:hypothetical protein
LFDSDFTRRKSSKTFWLIVPACHMDCIFFRRLRPGGRRGGGGGHGGGTRQAPNLRLESMLVPPGMDFVVGSRPAYMPAALAKAGRWSAPAYRISTCFWIIAA